MPPAEAKEEVPGAQAEQAAPGAASARPCARLEERAVYHLRAGHWLDAHVLAEVTQALCDAERRQRAQVHDAVALVRLGELERARARLADLRQEPDPLLGRTASTLESWALLQIDRDAFRASLARLEPAPRLRLLILADLGDGRDASAAVRRLGPGLREQVEAIAARLESRPKRPWLAGTLSAILPGAGQVYAGSWESAAVAFALNALLIGATAELALEGLYIAAATTGVAASIFYVGNIANAVDLARRRNQRAREADLDALERALLPEAFP